jgi:prolipoprotein diacylglyceryltransferase
MLPVLFRLGDLTVFTYGIFLMFGFFWFLYIIWKMFRLTTYKEDELFDKVFVALFFAIIMGRLAYMAFHFELILQKGVWAIGAIHLFPGVHGLTTIFALLLYLMVTSRGKKHDGHQLIVYMLPAICVSASIINLGIIFSGGLIGVLTEFPIRVKYAVYDGLRHVPAMYRGIAFAVFGYAYYKLIFWMRRDKVSAGVILSSFVWMVAFVNLITIPMVDFVSYGRDVGYRLYDIVLSVFMLLTAFVSLVYHWRSYFFALFKLPARHKTSHG